jgi:hypothetical protein
MLNTGTFWNLEKDYYSEVTNVGAGKYNSYGEFITGSKVNSLIKNFEYEDPFDFYPSYGSTATVTFGTDMTEFGDYYLNANQPNLNRVILDFDLDFSNRGDEESEKIIAYIKGKEGGGPFPCQPMKRGGLSQQDAFKSLYSIQPYFAQELKCFGISTEHQYVGHNNIKLNFLNQDYSQFSVRNLLYVEGMPQDKKDIIDEYFSKYHLDIAPSYSFTRAEPLNLTRFNLRKSRPFEGSGGVNKSSIIIDLEYNSITDEILLKLLSFFISKQGYETFSFDLKEPDKRTLDFVCPKIDHTYLYKNSNNLRVTLEESHIRRRFHWGY